ncbi:DUF6415 family natural product biosynthesis protein [Streptomyces sp. NPDC003832]
MPQPTEHPAPTTPAELDELLAQAAAALRILPTYDECRRLDRVLGQAIGVLADEVRVSLQYFAPDTADWARREAALVAARDALCGTLGDGLQSAARHVACLGEAARGLAECTRSV